MKFYALDRYYFNLLYYYAVIMILNSVNTKCHFKSVLFADTCCDVEGVRVQCTRPRRSSEHAIVAGVSIMIIIIAIVTQRYSELK